MSGGGGGDKPRMRGTGLRYLMGLFTTGKYLTGCCWCWRGGDDAIPFW